MLRVMPNDPRDYDLRERMERTIRRIKAALRYHGSVKTGDVLHGLLLRWIDHGRYESMRDASPALLRTAIHGFVVDQIRSRARRPSLDIDTAQDTGILLPDDEELYELVETAFMCKWLRDQIERLELGQVDSRVKKSYFGKPVDTARVRSVAKILRLASEGLTNREIAEKLGIGEETARGHLNDGKEYLAVLHQAGERDGSWR